MALDMRAYHPDREEEWLVRLGLLFENLDRLCCGLMIGLLRAIAFDSHHIESTAVTEAVMNLAPRIGL